MPFDVPGHKRGRGNPELVDLLGERCVGIDVNSMKPLDNLCHPVSVIKEAEELTADAFGAEHAFFMVGGTTQAVHYLNTEINAKLGIVLGVTVEQVEKTIQEHPRAVAVLVNNPTYYGICSDIKGICDIAHSYGLKVVLCQDLVQVKMSFSHSNLPAIPKLPVDTILQNHRVTYNRNDYEFVWYYKTFPSIQIPGGMHVCNC